MMFFFSVTHNTVRQKANSPQEVVGNEEWIHHFTPTSKWSTMQWKLSGLPRKKVNMTPSAGKVLAILLKCLWQAIRRKRVFLMKVWFSSVPMADCTWHSNLLHKFCWLMLDHPPYSPDLAPSDFHVSNLEGALSGHSFTCDEDVKCAIITWLMQQVVRSVCLGWANWSYTMTSSSIVKGTMLRNNVPVTPSLCTVSFLNQNWSQMYGYYKLTLGSTFMSVTADLSQAVSNPYMLHYNNSTMYKDSVHENA